MTTKDPWEQIARPSTEGVVTVRRIDDSNRWDLYWGKNTENQCLFVFVHDPASTPHGKLPSPKGIRVTVGPSHLKDKLAFTITLLDRPARQVFQKLCLDIAEASGGCATERDAIAQAVARTWVWHHLLRGGSAAVLPAHEQIGLMAELTVLERYFIANLDPVEAIRAWRGPEDAPQDFILGRVAVESKARGKSESDELRISSEFQLETTGLDALFIHLSAYEVADPGEGETLTEVVQRVRKKISVGVASASARLEGLLGAAGFRDEHDYSPWHWKGEERGIYRVATTFPRLIRETIPPGAADVRYSIATNRCGEFLVAPEQVITAVKGAKYVD